VRAALVWALRLLHSVARYTPAAHVLGTRAQGYDVAVKTLLLREIAHARSGDKGDTSNVGVIAYDEADYPILRDQVTVERVRALYGSLVLGEVTRYELPNIGALNFVLKGALQGGVTTSLALDPHGKTRSSLILELPIEVPDDYVPSRLR
jgi:hypothetical protein